MSLAVAFNAPYYTGPVGSVDAWAAFDVVLAGRPYLLDWEQEGEYRHDSIPLMRGQQDTSNRPGEQSINPGGLWRRSVESWHRGAGQSWLDRSESDPFRFATSKGVDPWGRYGLTLLPDTSLALFTAGSNLYLAVAAGRLYMADGSTVLVSGVGSETFTAASGLAGTVTALTSDGATCYAAQGGSGIYTSTGTAFTSFITGAVDLVRYAKGRLIAAFGPDLYNPTAAGPLPAPLFTHPSSAWTWTDITEGPAAVYAAGYAGDKSMIYRTAVKADGASLDVPVVAATLPDGERAESVTGYLGYVVIGTSLGVRFAVPDSAGNLTLGALIPTGSPVLCAEGQDRFVWYGLSNYDAASTGLGRLDLSTFTSDLTPAYASDLMAPGQGSVIAAATYLGKRWFTIASAGLYKQAAVKVASGTLSGGRVGFGLPDRKTGVTVTVRHDLLAAGQSVRLDLAADGAAAAPAGTSGAALTTEPAAPFTLTNVAGKDFEWTITITGDATVRSVTLRADPTSERSLAIYLPVLLRDQALTADGIQTPVDVYGEWLYLSGLRDDRRVVSLQEGQLARPVIVEDTQWRPWRKTSDGRFYQGTYLLKLKGV